MAALAPFVFSIDNHDFQVIAADAEPLKPSNFITNVTINAGQRYDLLVQAKASSDGSSIGSFWMRATGLYGIPWTAASSDTADEGFNDVGLGIRKFSYLYF
ncbi:Multicopper oxidase [Phytophthora infestans]|uniref:Multicopper oxidase n=1 Tax=Phytophthora infestans TaxID=4787 RepID=A0A833WPA4_PHYIN|nr:Multicopper oxidase [Phytophthora infestans]KAF4146177.1 Multicopper oxidase [Phytophthora infestans]